MSRREASSGRTLNKGVETRSKNDVLPHATGNVFLNEFFDEASAGHNGGTKGPRRRPCPDGSATRRLERPASSRLRLRTRTAANRPVGAAPATRQRVPPCPPAPLPAYRASSCLVAVGLTPAASNRATP